MTDPHSPDDQPERDSAATEQTTPSSIDDQLGTGPNPDSADATRPTEPVGPFQPNPQPQPWYSNQPQEPAQQPAEPHDPATTGYPGQPSPSPFAAPYSPYNPYPQSPENDPFSAAGAAATAAAGGGADDPFYPGAEQPTSPQQPVREQAYDTQFETLYGMPAGIAAGAAPDVVDESRNPDRQRGTKTIVLVAVTALLAGGIGGVTGAAIMNAHDNGNTSVSLPSNLDDNGSSSNASVNLPVGSVAAVAKEVLPSVVSITELASDGSGGEGSGVVLSKDGLILTNNHVVVDSVGGGSLTVTFQSGQTVKATIIGRDPTSDLAVIKVSGVTGLVPATLGDSSDVVVGQSVVAIGSPLGLAGTVTSGIISALNRPVTTTTPAPDQGNGSSNGNGLPSIPGFPSFGNGNGGAAGTPESTSAAFEAIQTDAAINPGNSGGPLVDLSGHVVGINSAIASLGTTSGSTQSGSIGVGFAIPIDLAKRIATQLIETGKAVHPLLGVTGQDATNGSGAQIAKVTAGSAAAKAGLKAGDVVVRVDNVVITAWDDLVAYVRSAAPGAKVTITYIRGGQTATTTATLGQTSS